MSLETAINNLTNLHNLPVTDAFIRDLKDNVIMYDTYVNSRTVLIEKVSLGLNWIIINLLKIFNYDSINYIHRDAINYENAKGTLHHIVGKLFGDYNLINYHINYRNENLPNKFLINAKVSEREEKNRPILYYDNDSTKKLGLPNIENYNLVLFLKYIYVHFAFGRPSYRSYCLICNNILSNVSKRALNEFIDVFVFKIEYTICVDYLFEFDKMLKNDLLDFYWELIKNLKVIPIHFKDIFHAIAYSGNKDAKYIILRNNYKHVFNINNAKLILDIFSHFHNLVTKLKNPIISDCYFLKNYVHNVINKYVRFEDIIELCSDKTYFQIIRNIGSVISQVKCLCCSTVKNRYNSISIERYDEVQNLDLLYLVIFLEDEYKKVSNDSGLLVKNYIDELIIPDKSAQLKLDTISKTSPIYENLSNILNNSKIFNDSTTTVTTLDVLEFYFGISNMLRNSIIHNNIDLVLNILNKYEPNQEDFEFYLKSRELSFGIVQKFINYKIQTTNEMLNNCFKSRRTMTIFDGIKGEDSNGPPYDPLILIALMDTISESLDHKMIEDNLTNIIYYFRPSVELLKTFKVHMDIVYYSCYLTNTINYYSEYFLSSNDPKYLMRHMVINKTTFLQFKKFIEKNNLEPDNYTLELCFKHKTNKKIVSYFDKDYILTVYAIYYLKGVAHKCYISLVARDIQTREYMEKKCLKKQL